MADKTPQERLASFGKTSVNVLGDDPNADAIAEMRKNRSVNSRRLGVAGNGARSNPATANVSFATARPRDPMFYWKDNNLPYDYTVPEELDKIREWCNTPDAPVLMADGTFKPIGEIQIGEEVMGWEWSQKGSKGEWRKYMRPSKVLDVNWREAPEVVEATMESGRVIRCTPDHKWANYWYSPGNDGVVGNEYEPLVRKSRGGRGGPLRYNTMVSAVEPVEELTDPKQVAAAGYLAGIIDGEGTVDRGAIRIAQSLSVNPEICARIDEALNILGLEYRVYDKYGEGLGQSVQIWSLKATASERAKLRTWLPLSVKVQKAWDERREMKWMGGKDRVVSVESIGAGEVVSMQTETGNYTAWGYASKNCRSLYITHPIISSAIDVFSTWPLTGIEPISKDDKIVDFYGQLFFDEGPGSLNYSEFLIDVGRQYWTVGEAWPLGSFNESLGVWEDDELINPSGIDVITSPFLREPRFEMELPQSIKKVLVTGEPQWEYKALMRSYPELKNFMGPDARMPVSNILLKQIAFKADPFFDRGLPILMRGFRTIIQEEMLNAAMDAISSRLYTPLILAKLGASATDLGTQTPWIPTPGDLAAFEESLDAALSGDFRVLTHHFATNMSAVFGREIIPNVGQDFDRMTDKILQIFGLSRTMLTGAGQGETYAADALNRDLISQLLSVYQRRMAGFFRERALVVAEAQEHFDYEEHGGKRFVIMEEVLEVDEESGEERIVEQPKLLVPDLRLKAMNLKDEEKERQFIETLRGSGVPISMQTRLINLPVDLDDEVTRVRDEQVQQAIEAQETRKATFQALDAAGLPIPEDLESDFRAKPMQAQEEAKAEEKAVPTIGTNEPADTMGLAPTPEDLADNENLEVDVEEGFAPRNNLPTNKIKSRPPESDEMRAGMPRASYRLRHVTAEVETDDEGNEVEVEKVEWEELDELDHSEGSSRLLSGPSHVGMRRYISIDKDIPLDED